MFPTLHTGKWNQELPTYIFVINDVLLTEKKMRETFLRCPFAPSGSGTPGKSVALPSCFRPQRLRKLSLATLWLRLLLITTTRQSSLLWRKAWAALWHFCRIVLYTGLAFWAEACLFFLIGTIRVTKPYLCRLSKGFNQTALYVASHAYK